MSTFASFDEFCAAMSRLYEQQPKHDQQIRELQAMIREHAQPIHQTSEQIKQTDARLGRLVSTVATLAGTVAKYLTISKLMSAGWCALKFMAE